MKEIQYYVLFPNHDNGMRLYKKLKEEGVGAVIAPTPRSASKCCGISLLVKEKDIERIRRRTALRYWISRRWRRM